jgi:hypothetical protein
MSHDDAEGSFAPGKAVYRAIERRPGHGQPQIHPNPATILPFTKSKLVTGIAWGLRQMVAGLVLFSVAVGAVAVAASIALSLPAWITIATYPMICSLTLLLTAAIQSRRQDFAHQKGKLASIGQRVGTSLR